jgi:hypothetical protein
MPHPNSSIPQSINPFIHQSIHPFIQPSLQPLCTPHSNGQPLDNQAPSSPIVPDKANLSIQQSTAPTHPPIQAIGSSVSICVHLWLNLRENSRNSRQVPPSSKKTITIYHHLSA